jgi:hypothetical protein
MKSSGKRQDKWIKSKEFIFVLMPKIQGNTSKE